MHTPSIDNRRNRQQVRRILAAYRNRWRDLSASARLRTELDIVELHDRLVIPHPWICVRGR